MTDPIKVRVTVDAWADLEITDEVLAETKRLAKKMGDLNDYMITNLLNEWVDSQLDLWSFGGKLIEYDFDWNMTGYSIGDLCELVRSEKVEAAPPPEIPGQMAIEQD